MITIEESGVIFGAFAVDSVYQIEKSEHLPSHVKPVEFAWVTSKGHMVLIEAKSSFSQPHNGDDFDKNVQDIYTKLVGSLTLLGATTLGRHSKIYRELPSKVKSFNWKSADVYLRLVIPDFRDDWLPPISDALRIKMNYFLSAFGIPIENFQVLNRRLAEKQGLLVKAA